MKTYYVVTRGDYSAYKVCAVTEDRERAEHLKLLFSRSDEPARVEEYHDDVPEEAKIGIVYPWHVDIYKYLNAEDQDRNRETVYQYCYDADENNGDPFETEIDYYEDTKQYPGYGYHPHVHLSCDVIAYEKEHALKIARDELAKRYAVTVGV